MRRRHEKPIARTNPSGARVWVARYTDRYGKRRVAGTFPLKGPCRTVDEHEIAAGQCCAQHAIDAAYERDRLTPRRPDTVGAYAATWTRRHPRSDRTNATNEHRLSRLLDVEVEGMRLRDWPMADLKRRHVYDLVHVLLVEQGRAVEGARGILRAFSAMFSDAVRKDEIVEVNVFRDVEVRATDPRVVKQARKPRVVSWDQMHLLAATAASFEVPLFEGEPTQLAGWRAVYAEPMIRTAADCGLRLGEVLGLYRADVMLGDGACTEPGCPFAIVGGARGPHLHVRRSAHDGIVRDGTKREKLRGADEGGRVVPVAAALAEMLRGLPPRIDSLVMFPTPSGRVWWEDNFRDDVWNPARRACGVDASPQDFRQSWVTHLRAAGADPADLAAMAGHSVETATAVYTHSLGRSFGFVAGAVGS